MVPLKYKSQYTLAAQPQKRLALMTHLSFPEEHTSFLSKTTNLMLALSEMMKLCPSWKVYQGWMGCDPFDSIAIPLCEVTVNKCKAGCGKLRLSFDLAHPFT